MYAVIATGGKQYRVEPGQQLVVERLGGEVGDEVALTPVMVVDDEGAVTSGSDIGDRQVTATIVGHDKAARIRVFTYKNKSRQRRARGHRQLRTSIRIEGI